jgi:hypothetical protein
MIRLTPKEELKAIGILFRHSPGMVLRGRRYVISAGAVEALRNAGVRFRVLTSESEEPSMRGAGVHERV